MPDPILTIDDLEPERPTIAINRTAPDGPWQAFKHRHFDVLLRWFPVRYVTTHSLYPLRLPSEFGLKLLGRMEALRKEVSALEERSNDAAALTRIVAVLREMAGIVLDAPDDVLDHLTPRQHGQIVMAFPAAVTGQTPTPSATENPPTSAASSPASAASTAPMTG